MAPKSMIKKMLNLAGIDSEEARQEKLLKDLIRHEARIGGTLFGQVPEGGRREFFCLDEHTWVWYEQWKDGAGTMSRTTKYSVRPSGVVKSQDGGNYHRVSDSEARKLLDAARNYQKRINSEIYSFAA